MGCVRRGWLLVQSRVGLTLGRQVVLRVTVSRVLPQSSRLVRAITENEGPAAVGPWAKSSLSSMSVILFCIIMLVFSIC